MANMWKNLLQGKNSLNYSPIGGFAHKNISLAKKKIMGLTNTEHLAPLLEQSTDPLKLQRRLGNYSLSPYGGMAQEQEQQKKRAQAMLSGFNANFGGDE